MSTLYFTDEHEWLSVEGDIAKIGITEHAQSQLGDLVFVELPDIGSRIAKGDDAAVVESVKAASDVYAPASGEVTETNPAVLADAELVNRDAEGEGWLYKIRLSNIAELEDLMDRNAYDALVG